LVRISLVKAAMEAARVSSRRWSWRATGVGCLAVLGAIAVYAGDLTVFFDPASLLITVGGTALVTLASFPRAQLRAVAAAVREAGSTREGADMGPVVEQVKEMARSYRAEGIAGLDGRVETVRNPFLRRGLELLLAWKAPEDLRAVLEGEYLRIVAHYEDCRRVLLTVGKLFPAFGLIGTLVGLVLLLRQPQSLTMDGVGPGLSLALLTTLYGALLANAVAVPLEAKVQGLIDHQRLQFEVGLRATQLIVEQAYPSLIDEQLGCFAEARMTVTPATRQSGSAGSAGSAGSTTDAGTSIHFH
jgi:chemotaxis protein MotA